jgi:exopolysaccharide biosynthesis polyprenyl glycosylphosphotransferase
MIKPLTSKSRNGRKNAHLPATPNFALRETIFSNSDGNRVFAEDAFRRILCWERKRVERSDRSFLLMLVDVESLFQANDGEEALSKTVSALCEAMRETDISGWYKQGAILGVIFIEIPKARGTTPKDLIRDKVMRTVRARLDAEQVKQLRFSFHLFPEDSIQTDPGRIDVNLYPDLFDRNKAQRWSRFVKRTMDVVGSALALAFCSPLLVLIAIAIKLTSKGPILFTQERVGWRGARFRFLKFRSMKCANDPSIHREYVRRFIAGQADSAAPGTNQKVLYKIQDDPRVTRVGKFLRRTSLDELPQFINVLRGEMSLVGPRPPIPYELEAYQIWHRGRVLEAKPGITGLWQVSGRSRLKFEDMVRLDLQYARTWSLWSDIKILLQTPRAALFCEGAY